MKKSSPQYLVGIDLGTTHTVVAYTKAGKKNSEIDIFQVEQLIAPGQVAARALLPSVRYHPADGELSDTDLIFSDAGETGAAALVIGEAARLLGAKTKGRLVTSAKSWLSHPSVDHNADILPWGSSEEVAKVSPIDASASYLAHIRTVWELKFPDAPLSHQNIVITVPASFDEGARSLTVEAAHRAGLPQVHLLEEPQAVCYDWLRRKAGNLKQALAHVHLLLVCDVGGGTTDLTLIKVEAGETEPKLTRIGVGDHLMLGGDNIDLALAHLAEKRLGNADKRLSVAEFSQLIEQCRLAKERLLAEDSPAEFKVTLLGGGAKLIGGSRSATFTREEVRELVLGGFFPLSGLNDLPDRKRSGVVEFGLPYAAEPAVSKHIAAFLALHAQAANQALNGEGAVPDALLLNGGVFRSPAITGRLLEIISTWRGKQAVLLENQHPELAVAFGAVSYAIARAQKQLKIGGGSARSYFLLLENQDGGTARHGLCLLPRGSEEGTELVLKDHRFALRLGTPIQFNLVSTTGDTEYQPGQLAEINDLFHALPPLVLAFQTETNRQIDEAVVELAVTLTEIGTLKIQCVAVNDSKQRWGVEFQIRKKAKTVSGVDTVLAPQFAAAAEKIQLVFGSKSKLIDARAVKNLRTDMEKRLGADRNQWETPLLRALFAELMDGSKYRRRTENHERVWLSLTGFCLRPGFGYTLDDWRLEELWHFYAQGIQFVNEPQNWMQWWTLWRRVAGGLKTEAQEQIFADIEKYINPAAARQPSIAKQIKTRSYDEIIRLAAVLERLPVAKKVLLSEWLLKRLEKNTEPAQSWWALGRIASRQSFYGSNHNVIPAETVAGWLKLLLKEDWRKTPLIGFAATLISRKTGDRARDIDEALRAEISAKLRFSKAPASWIELVEEVKLLDEQEEMQIFGEALPPGLKLLHTGNL